VDPQAREFRPIRFKLLLSIGLILWSSAALLAVLTMWAPRVAELFAVVTGRTSTSLPPAQMTIVLIALSGIGALTLINPHDRLPMRTSIITAIGVALYGPLIWIVWQIASRLDSVLPPPYIGDWSPVPERIAWRLALSAVFVLIVLCLRPHARVLVARSLAMRTGRVDRQTLLALALATLVVAAGDVLLLISTIAGSMSEFLRYIGTLVIVMGSALITIGIAGAFIDCLRIARAIRAPGPSLQDVLMPVTMIPDEMKKAQEPGSTGSASG
jgi:hypothetical protein